MKKRTKKYLDTSKVKYLDKNPTQITLSDGSIGNPDKEGRFSVAHMEGGERKYLYDGEEVSYENAFGALAGRDSIPSRLSMTPRFRPGQYEKIFKRE